MITVVSSILEACRGYQRKVYFGHETISQSLPGVLVDFSKRMDEGG